MESSEPLDLRLLDGKPYVAGFDDMALSRACRTLFTDAGIEPQIVARIHTHHLAGRLVQRGLGFAILDSITVRALKNDRLREEISVLKLQQKASLPLVAIFPARGALSNPARLFLNQFATAYRQVENWAEQEG